MSVRHKVAISSAAVLVALLAFAATVWLGMLTPSAPAGWSQVHVGMGRDAVLSLAGEPQHSGWPEKVVESWDRSGLICRHRLLVGYRAEQRGDGSVQSVCEGTWLRGYGWLHPRQELR